MKTFLRMTLFLLVAAMLLGTFAACDGGSGDPAETTGNAQSETQPSTDPSTEGEGTQPSGDFVPVLRFAIASDIHITNEASTQAQRTKQMLSQLGAYASTGADGYSKLDAVAFTGDITDNGTAEEFRTAQGLLTQSMPKDTQLVITMGNHDYNNLGTASQAIFDSVFKQKSSSHVVIGGYHFITVSVDANNGWEYSAKTVQWFETELDKAYEDSGPNKPIFVFQHVANKETIAGSCEHALDAATLTLMNQMKKYPNVVNFSGHSHWPSNDEFAVHQKDFTSVVCGTLYYATRTLVGKQPIDMPNRHNIAQCWVAEVDANNRLRLRAWDVLENKFVGETFLIESYKTEDFVYTPGRYTAEDIFFAEGAQIETVNLGMRSLRFKFPVTPADSLPGRVYKAEVLNESGTVVNQQYIGVEYYHDDFDAVVTADVGGLTPNTKYTLKVYALNTQYGSDIQYDDTLYSEPLMLEFTTEAENGEQNKAADVLDVVIDATNNRVYDQSAFGMAANVIGAPAFSHDASIGMDILTFPGNTSNVVEFGKYTGMAAEMKYSMTFECYFKVNQMPEDRNFTIVSAQQSGGFGIDVYKDGSLAKFHYHSGMEYKSLGFPVQTGRYYHLVAAYDGTTYTLYVDGQRIDSVAIPAPLHFPGETNQEIYMGGDTSLSGDCETPSKCSIALLRIYSRALSADEVTASYNELQAKKG